MEAMLEFIEVNGKSTSFKNEGLVSMALAVAEGIVTFEAFHQWVELYDP